MTSFDSGRIRPDRHGCGCFTCGDVHGSKTPGMDEPEAVLAKAMNELTRKERNHALHDLHGVAEEMKETPGFIDERLDAIDREMEKIKQKKAYYIAKAISTNYTTNKKLRVKFLRAENYDPEQAAARMVRYFEAKMEIFGKDKVTCDIRLSDLSREDLVELDKGHLHLLPRRDTAGRAVVCAIGKVATTKPIEARLRILFSFLSLLAEDETIQRKGVVIIYYGIGYRHYYLENGLAAVRLLRCVPIAFRALHVCYDNPLVRPLLHAIVEKLQKPTLCRLRFHYGSHMECLNNLLTFGIPKSALPFTASGDVDPSYIRDWIRIQVKNEAKAPLSSRVIVPGNRDVLMGRGKRVLESPGNVHFRYLLQLHRNQYEAVSKFEKTLVIEVILQKIRESGGRFLTQGDDGWTEVDDDLARNKIGHAFRNLRTPPPFISRNPALHKEAPGA